MTTNLTKTKVCLMNLVKSYKVKIYTDSLIQKLEELLQKKDLNGRKWLLLYQWSRDGFEASDFHSRCDGKPKTLTLVKSSNENIFGGYTILPWQSIYKNKIKYNSG